MNIGPMHALRIRAVVTPAAFAVLGLQCCSAAPSDGPRPTLAPGSYVCGGIGEQGRQDMRVTRDLYNLRLSFAEVGTGAYIAGVTVVVDPVGQGARYGPFPDCGPLFNLVVQPGTYRVTVTHAGVTLTRIFRVGKTAALGTFYWPGESGDQGRERRHDVFLRWTAPAFPIAD